MKNHPLFPEAPDADIEGFHVTRHGASGNEYAYPLHDPEQIQDLSQIFELYGGGSYELIARGILGGKNGEKGRKGIIARVSYRLGGDPKPLNPGPPVAPGAPIAAAAPSSGGSDTAAILGFMGQQMTAQMQLMSTIITASLSNRGQSDQGSVAAINALGEVVKAALARPVHETAAPQQDPLKLVMDLGDWLNGVRQGAANVAAKVAAGQDATIDLEQIAKFAEKAVDVVKKAKGLAEEGKPAVVAAEELARQAAAAE